MRQLLIFLFLLLVPHLLAQSGQEVLEFAFISDTHGYGATSDLRLSKTNTDAFVSYCKAHPELQLALFGGDFYNDFSTNHDQGIACLKQAWADFEGLDIPFYTTRGNHDTNGKCKRDGKPDNSQIVTDAEYYELFSPLSPANVHYHPEGIVTDSLHPQGNYYYRDLEEYRVRFIILNNYDSDSLEVDGFHGPQLKWLTEQALNFANKPDAELWNVVLLSHRYFVDFKGKPISRILHAYVHGLDFCDTVDGVFYSAQFSNPHRGKFVAFLSGHYHEDSYMSSDGYNIIATTRGYATDGEMGDDAISFNHFVLDTRNHTLTQRRIGRGRDRIFSYNPASILSPSLAFPEADGLGALTVGGRSGRHLVVTNLADHGPGSFRWAVQQPGCRYVTFAVSGTIHLDTPLIIDQDSLTVAGQSAPTSGITTAAIDITPTSAPGITLTGAPITINASEVILRYLTLHTSLTDGNFGQHNLVLDHLTSSMTDGTGICILKSQDVTVQQCRFLSTDTIHPALVAGGFCTTYYNNLFLDCPRALFIAEEEGCNRWIHIDHSVFINWKDHAIYGGGKQGEATIMKNYFVPGQATTNPKILDTSLDGSGRYYMTLNTLQGEKGVITSRNQQVNDLGAKAFTPSHPVARARAIPEAKSSLVVASFQNKPVFNFRSYRETHQQLLRQAGSDYRPEPVCQDSLLSDNYQSYLDRIVAPDRSIVILFGKDSILSYNDILSNDPHSSNGSCSSKSTHYSLLSGLCTVFASDTSWVGTLPLDQSLPSYHIQSYGHRKVAFINDTHLSTTDDRISPSDDIKQDIEAADHSGATYIIRLSDLHRELHSNPASPDTHIIKLLITPDGTISTSLLPFDTLPHFHLQH